MYGYVDVEMVFLDGRTEKALVRSVTVKDGVLRLEDPNGRGEYRLIPLATLREWKEKHG